MVYFKRFLWLAAWSVWVWLGFGLSRELPRDLGRSIAQMDLHGKEQVNGFLHGRPTIVTADFAGDERLPTYRLRNARSGDVESSMSSEGQGIDRRFHFAGSLKHGFEIRYDAPAFGSQVDWKVHLLNLDKGEWRTESDLGRDPKFHSNKARVALNRFFGGSKDDAIIVVDLKTGGRLLDTRTRSSQDVNYRNTWSGVFVGVDRLAIPVTDSSRPGSRFLELWSLSTGRLERRLDDMTLGDLANAANDKIVWYEMETPYITEVFDLETGRRLLAIPPDPKRIIYGRESISVPPTFSEDGNSILSAAAGGLFDISTGVSRWAAKEHERVWIARGNRFEVNETWKFNLWSWSAEFTTFAVRSLDDGALIYRCKDSTLGEFRSNDEGTLSIGNWSRIYELPPRVDAFLLALCQTILALPLILLWAILRWRRRRKAVPPSLA